jgi:hypothetical protein
LPRQCDKHMTPKLKRASNFNSHVFAPGISWISQNVQIFLYHNIAMRCFENNIKISSWNCTGTALFRLDVSLSGCVSMTHWLLYLIVVDTFSLLSLLALHYFVQGKMYCKMLGRLLKFCTYFWVLQMY